MQEPRSSVPVLQLNHNVSETRLIGQTVEVFFFLIEFYLFPEYRLLAWGEGMRRKYDQPKSPEINSLETQPKQEINVL